MVDSAEVISPMLIGGFYSQFIPNAALATMDDFQRAGLKLAKFLPCEVADTERLILDIPTLSDNMPFKSAALCVAWNRPNYGDQDADLLEAICGYYAPVPAGQMDGQRFYVRADGAPYLFWSSAAQAWHIADVPGSHNKLAACKLSRSEDTGCVPHFGWYSGDGHTLDHLFVLDQFLWHSLHIHCMAEAAP